MTAAGLGVCSPWSAGPGTPWDWVARCPGHARRPSSTAGTRGRRALGAMVVVAVAVAGFAATTAITAFLGAYTVS